MIRDWLKETVRTPKYKFKVVDIEEKSEVNQELLEHLSEIVLFSYRSPQFLKHTLGGQNKDKIIEYIDKSVLPGGCPVIIRNIRQGDFGEILSKEIVTKIRGLNVPICKLMWKFNKDKSVFCTDIFAHNSGSSINELTYFEVKTCITKRNDICIKAYECLNKDLPTEPIADYLQRLYFSKAETLEENGASEKAKTYYDLSSKYADIVLHSSTYRKNFEIILVIEKSKFDEELIKKLNELPQVLNPLCVTVILISNFKDLYMNIYECAKELAIKLCCKNE